MRNGRTGGRSCAYRAWAGRVIALALIAGGCRVASAGLVPGAFHASQKGQAFRPGEMSIKRGNTIEIVNDDGDILHHAYIEFEHVQLRFGRPGAWRGRRDHVSGDWDVQCPVRHPSKDAVAGAGRLNMFQVTVVPNRSAWTP